MDLLLDACVWVEDRVGFREEVGWIGGLSVGKVDNGQTYCEEGVALLLAKLFLYQVALNSPSDMPLTGLLAAC